MADADADWEVARGREDAIDDLVPFVVTEAAGLAQDTQDGHPVDTAIGDESGERRQARGIE